ncbi:preprotein translocase subunit SecD [Streptomyces sp. NPDC021224]|uniref:preprotein translocase subunit SecD n=1 Tax=unclassified Streptomyces TaxID=2593676 RepID=UPI0037A5A7F4
MLPHRKAYAAALAAVVLVLGPAVSGCSDSGGSPMPAPPSGAPQARTTTTYTASRADSGAPTAEDMRTTADRLRERAKSLGLKNTDVTAAGTVVTIVAPRADSDRVAQMTATALLEFRPVLDPATAAQQGLGQAYSALACDGTTRAITSLPDGPAVACDSRMKEKYLLGPTALPGTDVESATAALDTSNGSGWIINLAFTPSGSTEFAQVTAKLAQNLQPANQFAVVVDGEVLSAPAVNSAITGGQAQISGSFTREAAENLAAAISSGALPVQLVANGTGR